MIFMKQELEKPKTKMKKVKSIEDLPGIGPATVEKLASAGCNDLMSIAVATPGEIIGATEVSEATAKKVIAVARANMELNFESGEALLQKRMQAIKISTGSKDFDKLLGGGFETGSISEVYGQFGSGKSQIAHVLAVRAQLPLEEGGANGSVIFIDTEGTFRPERIIQIAEPLGLDTNEILKKIKVARAYTSDHQMLLADKIKDLIEKGDNVRVVVIDSLTSHFRAEFIGRGTLADRQQKINKHMHVLMRLADKHNVLIYVTNQVMSKPDMFFGDPTAAIGGHIVGHNSTYRIYIRKGKKGSRVVKMVDAPNLPENEAGFFIKEQGLVDV
jgi:DNA repair protein RadA